MSYMPASSRSLVVVSSTVTNPGRFQIQSLAMVGVNGDTPEAAAFPSGIKSTLDVPPAASEKSSKQPKSSCLSRVRSNSMAWRATSGPYTSSSEICCCLIPAGKSEAMEIMPIPRINIAMMSSTKLKARLECCRVIA